MRMCGQQSVVSQAAGATAPPRGLRAGPPTQQRGCSLPSPPPAPHPQAECIPHLQGDEKRHRGSPNKSLTGDWKGRGTQSSPWTCCRTPAGGVGRETWRIRKPRAGGGGRAEGLAGVARLRDTALPRRDLTTQPDTKREGRTCRETCKGFHGQRIMNCPLPPTLQGCFRVQTVRASEILGSKHSCNPQIFLLAPSGPDASLSDIHPPSFHPWSLVGVSTLGQLPGAGG